MHVYDRTTGEVFRWETSAAEQREAVRRATPSFPPGLVMGVTADQRGDIFLVGSNGSARRVNPGLFRVATNDKADRLGGDNWQAAASRERKSHVP